METVSFCFEHDEYDVENFSCDVMAILGSFFTGDYYLCGYNSLIEWANDPELYLATGNLNYLRKKNGLVAVGSLYEKEHFETFDLPIEQFIKLLNEWERVTKQKPKEIVITWDGKEIDVEGKH